MTECEACRIACSAKRAREDPANRDSEPPERAADEARLAPPLGIQVSLKRAVAQVACHVRSRPVSGRVAERHHVPSPAQPFHRRRGAAFPTAVSFGLWLAGTLVVRVEVAARSGRERREHQRQQQAPAHAAQGMPIWVVHIGPLRATSGRPGRAPDNRNGRPPRAPIKLAQTPASPWRSSVRGGWSAREIESTREVGRTGSARRRRIRAGGSRLALGRHARRGQSLRTESAGLHSHHATRAGEWYPRPCSSSRMLLALQIQRRSLTNEVLQCIFVNLVIFLDVDGTPDLPVKAGVE